MELDSKIFLVSFKNWREKIEGNNSYMPIGQYGDKTTNEDAIQQIYEETNMEN